ncbi:sialidase family protein [Actinomadura livida]|uniref:Uncharacterized protein n=1 Tax=Actinomadura livida TaxID=79909 RepID=A0A7W7MWH5_9ACTN|nr:MULTISPECIES: sialidase family protein [Actinomadura]MBB4772822.1 hypothetical protein [Actinomadura catellatispora]GGU12961.1 hypothetical protein GCM10010208_42370 [Actinomadura livida]
MTATGKPDDDHAVERPEPGQPAPAPPPPQWLSEQPSSPASLLPGDDPEEDGPGEAGTGSGQSTAAQEAPEESSSQGAATDDSETQMVDRTISDRTMADSGEEPSHTVVVPMATSTDIPAPPPFPYTPEAPEAASAQAPAQPPAQPPAPPPFPYGQEIPDATRAEGIPQQSPMPPPPPGFPPQAPPAAPPAASPSQSPPAHAPFPYAQEIPGTPAAPAREPFPYAQEVPGAPSGPPAAEPFPWAQQVPGAQVPGAPQQNQGVAGPPAPPPPVIDEPWRTPQGKKPKGPRKSLKKPLLIGVAGLAVAALVAAGAVFVPGLLEGDGEKKTGAELAGSIFPVSGTARTDGRDQEIAGVAAVGSTVVAVGGETDPQNARGVFLVSNDGGRTFESVPPQGTDGGAAAPGGIPEAVGGSSRGWVAIGSRTGGGAVWLSEDGREWRRQPDAVGDVFGLNNRVQRIVATGNGYLAIGENSPKGDFSDSRPALWLSTDGRRWEPRVADQIGLQISGGEFALVEAANSGNVILLEGLVTPDGGKDPYRRVWRSEDGGRTWAGSDVPVPKGSRGLMIGGSEAGFLAVREMKSSGDFYGQAYFSRDGRTWGKAGTLKAEGYKHTSRIVGDRQGYAAIVFRDRDVLVSRSADGGASWKDAGTAELKPGLKVMGAALAGGQAVLAGHEPGGGDTDAMLGVWDAAGTAVPVDLAKITGAVRPDHSVTSVGATDALAVAVGSARGDAAAWSSKDGTAWTPAQGLGAAFTRPGPQQLTDVAGGAAGWLAVGYDQAAPRGPLVVTSEDGATWQTADSDAAFAASREGVPVTNAAAAGDAGYVVVGIQGASVAAWFSPDLKSWERGTGTDPQMMRGGKNAGRWMLDVTAGPSGFTAVGGSREAKRNRPSVWTSPDGKQWTLQVLQLPAGVNEAHFTHVAARGSTLVATGLAATQKGLDWLGYVSTDAGKSWQPLKSPSEGTPVKVTALTATPDGFAATGTTGAAGGTDVVSWTSPDGLAWSASTPGGTGLGGVGDQEITGLASFGSTLLGVGRSADSNGDQPVLWSR